MEMDDRIMPSRVATLVDGDYVVVPQYCEVEPTMQSFRMDAVEHIYQMSHGLDIGNAAAWTAVRLFDTFYAASTNSAWQLQTPIVSAVCLDIAGKSVSWDLNPCGHPRTIVYFYNTICNRNTVTEEKFKQFFFYVESVVLNALKFDVMIPTPDEYLSECSRWFDTCNAARGSPKRPLVEVNVASMTSYIVSAIMYSPQSMSFTALEIAGYASYIATEPARTSPQSHIIDPPTMKGLWSMIAWTRSNKLSEILLDSIEMICKNKPDTILARIYPLEHEKWKATCQL